MDLHDNKLYQEDIEYAAGLPLPWDRLKNKSMLISGATGLIGRFITDVLMYLNNTNDLNLSIYALCRNKEAAGSCFKAHKNNDRLIFMDGDVNNLCCCDNISEMNFVLHMASNTHPVAYAEDPIGTVSTNVIGTKNMLDYAAGHHAERFLFTSSNEIYGENRDDTELFDEKYCGYIDCNTMRAGYPESKRCGEALCQAYIVQKKLDVVIPRITRSYGPTMKLSDSKAMSQFIKKALAGENIVLKSEGKQFYSYTYVADAAAGLLTVLLSGKCGEAYNVSDGGADVRLKDVASYLADIAGTKVVFEIPDAVEQSGYSKVTKSRLDGSKLKSLGWDLKYDVKSGVERTFSILKDIK